MSTRGHSVQVTCVSTRGHFFITPLLVLAPTSSADWRCSTCGMTNQSALLEGEDDESLSAEAADIASQMSFKVSCLHVRR